MILSYLSRLGNKDIIIVFLLVFVVLYLYVFNEYDNASNFFIIAIAVIWFLINNHNKSDNIKKHNEIHQYMFDIEKTVVSHSTPEMVLESVYKLHKPLKSLRFINNNTEATHLVYYLRFLNIYNREGYLDFIIYLEYFLKIHYNIMIGKYDVETNFVILKDVRYELLNALQSSYFNIPKVSTVFDSNDLDERVRLAVIKLQALTYRYVKIVYKKYHNIINHQEYKGTIAFDKMKNNNFHIY